MIRFTYKHEHPTFRNEDEKPFYDETIIVQIDGDKGLDDMLETFGMFLRAVGYIFDGNIEIVEEE